MWIFLLDILKIVIAIISSLLITDEYVRFKDRRRKKRLNPMTEAVNRRRKQARYENEHCGANHHIPFDPNERIVE